MGNLKKKDRISDLGLRLDHKKEAFNKQRGKTFQEEEIRWVKGKRWGGKSQHKWLAVHIIWNIGTPYPEKLTSSKGTMSKWIRTASDSASSDRRQ